MGHTGSHEITRDHVGITPFNTDAQLESHHPRLPTNLQYAHVNIYNDTVRKIRARGAKNAHQKSAVHGPRNGCAPKYDQTVVI
eukprot:1184228-Prorocentrum_minimum.AAC.2